MSDRRLQVFHTVARQLSFTKAAELLHMTQPAVTFQIRQLEEQLNTRLFDRTHNRISLTQAGCAVFERADKIFALYQDMEDAVRALTGQVSGTVVLGASTTIAEYMLPALLGGFKQQFPEANIQLKVSNTEGIVSMLENNTLDIGVVEAPVLNKNLVVEGCREDQLVGVVPRKHPLAGRKRLQLKDLLDYPFIFREEGSGTREVINEYLAQAGLQDEVKMCMELGSPEAIKGAIEAGMGVSILSKAIIGKELKLGTLAFAPLEPPLRRPFSFVYKKQKFRLHAVEQLLTFARNYCKAHHDDPL